MISIVKGDITKLNVDAIVNAANCTLLGGGGVDGAIHWAAGPELLEECRALNGCKTGEAKITKGYNLPAKYVIHAVGPIYPGNTKEAPALLRQAYTSSFLRALEKKLRTIAFPCISTGVYGYPKEEAAKIACSVMKEWEDSFDEIICCVFTDEDYAIYQAEINA